MEEHDVDWDITYDDRGHFTEPHTGHSIGLGTISVREYLASVDAPQLEEPNIAVGSVGTRGPDGCFGAVLFIEKEGFVPLFEAVHLAERFDLAIMSTKGMPSTAARTLIEKLCRQKVPLLALHDFDKAGLSIIGTLQRDTRRFTFSRQTEIVDLGLRLSDVQKLGLEASAEAAFDRGSELAKRQNLQLNGATREEVEFLLTRRVELNALTSDRLVSWIERKLRSLGIHKVMPNDDVLGAAYAHFVHGYQIQKKLDALLNQQVDDAREITAPSDLIKRVQFHLRKHPTDRWDDALRKIASLKKKE
jgi:Protein of unknown function C-terminus (DUF2399)